MSHAIHRHFEKKADINRLLSTDVSEPDKLEYGIHLQGVKCHVQPLEDNFGGDITGGFGKDYLMFCDYLDIKEGDQAVIDGKKYRVMSSEQYHFLGTDRHMEVRIRDFE